MNKIFLIIFFQIYFLSHSFSQVAFVKSYGDTTSEYPYAGGITADNGYFLAGGVSITPTDEDFCLFKTDSLGNLIFGKTYGTTGVEYFYSGIETLDGGFLLSGSTDTTNNAVADIYIVKTDADGNLQWAKNYAGSDYEMARSAVQTSDSCFLIVGATKSFGAGGYDCYLLKLDPLGNILWAKTYGSLFEDDGLSIIQTADGGFAIAGETLGFGSGGYDSWFLKTDASGNLEWVKTYGGLNYEYTSAVIQTADHGYLQAGSCGSFGVYDYEGYLIKTDSTGNLEWSKCYGDSSNDHLNSAFQTSDGGYVVTFSDYNFMTGKWDGMYIKTDASGDTLWTRTLGGYHYNHCANAEQTADGGYVVIGSTTEFGAGTGECLLIKTDSLGHGGCFEKTIPLTIASTATQVTAPTPTVSVPNFIVGSPVTTVRIYGIETVQCYTDAVTEVSTGTFMLYPNPVSTGNCRITIQQTDNFENFSYGIYDICGKQLMQTGELKSSKQDVLLDLSPGIYFVRLFNSVKLFTQKLAVQ